MREKIKEIIEKTVGRQFDFDVNYPDAKFGDYATNAALVLSKELKQKPQDVAKNLITKMDQSLFEKVEVAGPGFINFTLKTEELLISRSPLSAQRSGKILLEYFQPNIAKPLHVGHLRTAIIGDCLKRMLLYSGYHVESDTHMGDWGTQFGYLILAQKKFGEVNEKRYADINADESNREAAKAEFVKLEKGDAENRKIWQELVERSVKEFLQINELMDILPFDHHWPESFYEDKMPAVVEELKKKKILVESQGAQIVNLEEQKLGIAVIIKSDRSTTYLLRDLATYLFCKQEGFDKHLYVVDNRQSLHYKQLFKILELMEEIPKQVRDGSSISNHAEFISASQPGVHIDYGFISFKGQVLSTRKGNMVLAEDVLKQAEEKVAKIIAEKNPDLKNKELVIKAVTKSALKYFDLKHNRHSDIEFDWDEVLDFEGDSGPYLQYAYTRLCGILKKAPSSKLQVPKNISMTNTEREILFKLSILDEIVEDALKDYMPNVLAHYLYDLAGLINKFYHESPVVSEKNGDLKSFRLALIMKVKDVLGKGLQLLGIEPLEEM